LDTSQYRSIPSKCTKNESINIWPTI
jgi:hypothetical protein